MHDRPSHHHTRRRKQRSDAGHPQLTSRDLLILPWIAHQYAARIDQVQELLSRYPGKPMKDELISEAVTRDQVTRWRKAGWVDYKRFLAEGPGWVWLTRKGLQTIELDALYSSKAPAATRLYHIYAANEVRGIVEANGYDNTWISERFIRSQVEHVDAGERSGPIPDGYLAHSNGNIAIEVELTPKKVNDLYEKLRALVLATNEGSVRRYPAIWIYVPDESMKRAVEAARAKLPERWQTYISVLDFDLDGY
jgi:hypothetical protein